MLIGSGYRVSHTLPVLGNRGYFDKIQILQSKLLLLHHIATLEHDALAREVFEVQKRLNLPGFILSVKHLWSIWG